MPFIVCGVGRSCRVPDSKSWSDGEVQQDAPVSINMGNEDMKGKSNGCKCCDFLMLTLTASKFVPFNFAVFITKELGALEPDIAVNAFKPAVMEGIDPTINIALRKISRFRRRTWRS